MQDITTPSISALESIDAHLLMQVSGGCGKKRRCARPAPPPPPPPTPVPTAQMMGPQPQPQQTAGGDSVTNSITITTAGGTQTRMV